MRNKKLFLLCNILCLFLFTACKNTRPIEFFNSEIEPQPNVKPALGNARKVLKLALNFSEGLSTVEEVQQEFSKLSDTQKKQLAIKEIDGQNFLLAISKGGISQEIVEIAKLFLASNSKEINAKLLAKNSYNTPFDCVRALESSDEKNQLLALYLVAHPHLVNHLKDEHDQFAAEEFNNLIEYIDENQMANIAHLIEWDHLKVWLEWAYNPYDQDWWHQRLLKNFAKIYCYAGAIKQLEMRSHLLSEAYSADVVRAQNNQPSQNLLELLDVFPELKLDKKVGEDTYHLSKIPLGNGKHSGPLLYVMSKRLSEEIFNGGELNWKFLRVLSAKIKIFLEGSYEHHIINEKFGIPFKESILASIENTGHSRQCAKISLNASIKKEDIYRELLLINYNDEQKVSSKLKTLLQDFLKENANFDAIASINIRHQDHQLGALRYGDSFFHALVRLNSDILLLEVIRLFTKNLNDSTAIISQENSDGHSALALLSDPDRPASSIDEEHSDIVQHLLSEVLEHGDENSLMHSFNALKDFNLLADFIYQKRHSIVLGHDRPKSMASLFVAHYSNHAAIDAKAMAKALIETALKNDGIGSMHNGVASLINHGFFTAQALQTRGYQLFESGVYAGVQNTLLYEIFLHAAAEKIVQAIAQAYPNHPHYARRYRQTKIALDAKIRGSGAFGIHAAVGNFWVANKAIESFEGALLKDEISIMTRAFKSQLSVAEWGALCGARANATSNDKMLWELLLLGIAGKAVSTEAEARSHHYLDY